MQKTIKNVAKPFLVVLSAVELHSDVGTCFLFRLPGTTSNLTQDIVRFCTSLFFLSHLVRGTIVVFGCLVLSHLVRFFVGRFFPDSHSSALVRISIRFERTEVRSLPLFLSSHSSLQLGCLHAASLQPRRASLTPLDRVRVPLVFVRVISGIPSLLYRNSVSLSLPARFVARRVALFWNLHFFGVFQIFLLAFLAFSLQQAALSSI